MESIAGLTAVVTGGGSGIGRGIGLAFARAGANVVALDVQAQAALSAAEAFSKAARKGARAIGLRCDVTDPRSLEAARDVALGTFGAVNLLSNNAGVVLPQSRTYERDDADWRYVFEVNLFGIVASVRTFLPALRTARERGQPAHIVNTASAAGLISTPKLGVGIYTASKMACVGYSEVLRGELEDEGIGVSSLCPGFVLTELSRTSAENRPDRFGGASDSGSGEVPEALRKVATMPEAVGEIVVAGILANRKYIFTSNLRRDVEARFRGILDELDVQLAKS